MINDDGEKIELYNVNKKCYTPKLRRCVYSLLEHNVRASQVQFVISDVLLMLDYRPDKLPSKTNSIRHEYGKVGISTKAGR